ncbi:MAG: carboxypeptidase regulatory-like domain-containing protein [Deltaproteobacteria bacterium]|nr:carboxypeptidase regulatory-like domain-containing protein [Deltaproteobacteria bacterium]
MVDRFPIPRATWGAVLSLGALLVLGIACGGGGNATVKCVTNSDCPDGQICVAGDCVLGGGDEVNTCDGPEDCDAGYDCIGGICRPRAEEPGQDGGDGGHDGGQDGGGDLGPDGGDGPADGDGGGGDQALEDFSGLSFTVALGTNGSTAAQCFDGVRPAASQGPVLPGVTAVIGHTVSGSVRSGGSAVAGAIVSMIGQREACAPDPVTADGSGRFSVRLPTGGPFDLQAVAPDGRVGHLHLNYISADVSQDISVPETQPLQCSLDGQGSGWTVLAYERGSQPPRLAHTGVQTDAEGVAQIPLEVGPAFDLFARPPAAESLPFQLLLEDCCHLDQGCENDVYAMGELQAIRVRSGVSLSGSVALQGGGGLPGCPVELVDQGDERLAFGMLSGTGGSYQLLVRPSTFEMRAWPSGSAFGQGAMRYAYSGIAVFQDATQAVTLAVGRAVEFSGRVTQPSGQAVANAPVRLLLDVEIAGPGAYPLCDTQLVQTDAQGRFTVRCNLIPH